MKYWIPDIIASLLVLLFAYTATSKFSSYSLFENQFSQIPVIGSFFHFAILVPATEFLIAALLVPRQTQLLGLYTSAVLLIVFTIYIGAMLIFASNLPCSCGGVLKQLSWRQHLVFNLFFIVLAFTGIIWYWKKKTKEATV